MKWLISRVLAFLLLAHSSRSFRIQSTPIYCSKFSSTSPRFNRGLLSLRLSENPERRLAVKKILLSGFVAFFGLKESSSAPLSGADPEDKTRLLQAIQVISDLESEYEDPAKWLGIIKTLSKVRNEVKQMFL